MGLSPREVPCRVTRTRLGLTAVIAVAGAVDMLTAPQLEAAIAESLTDKPAALIVDLTETDFLASAGLNVLAQAHETADRASIGFGVVADSPATSRPIQLIGLAATLNLQPNLDQARASLANADTVD